ncbi:MAG: fimbria/pilus outer membrane usher protein, partial [Pseudomonadota bacterium]
FAQLGQSSAFGQTPRTTLTASVAGSFGGGGAGLTYLHQTTWQGDRFRSLSVNCGRALGALGYISLFASRTFGSATGTLIGVNLIRVLGAETSASVGSSRSRDRQLGAPDRDAVQTVAQLQGSAPAGPGWGYLLQAERGAFDRISADANLQTEHASFSVGAARSGAASTALRAGASGAVAWMPEGVFASRRIDGSFAVVKVGDYAGVRVTRDNQFVARTDANGHAFVAGLRGFETNRLGVEAADLPLDAQVDQLHVAVAPGRGSGVSVHFPVLRTRAATLRLVTADGSPVPPGSRVRIDAVGREFPVGFDGRLFLAGLGDRTTIVADWGDAQCSARVSLAGQGEPVPELGMVECR